IHSYRRLQNRRARRSRGGIIIYIKDYIRKGVKLIKNDIDSLIWLKFDKQFFKSNEDLYVGITYIAPETSPVHNLYDFDIFKTIQDDVAFTKTRAAYFRLVT
ncbi:MAG: hypothetical protein AB2705_22780, partial [Candidatus Thiodiazotropha sp.]